MSGMKKLFIVEDHQLFREGLKAMLAGYHGIEMIGEWPTGTKPCASCRN